MMKIIDILTSPWAIIPEKLYEIQAIYSTHLRGDKIDLKVFEEKTGPEEQKEYQVTENIAIIPIYGVIAKRMNMFSRFSGGVSSEITGNYIKDALKDEKIKGIILDIDSGGGTVDGTMDLANIIYAGRDIKPIVTYSDGMIASAALWIGAAASKTYISSNTVAVGSIGVVATHVDYSEYEKMQGIKTTEIYAGRYKRITSEYEPLSEEGRNSLQEKVDYLYTIFVDEIAKFKNVSHDTVLEKMADGRLFIGQQGIDAGLVDGVSTFDQVIAHILPVMEKERTEDIWLTNFNEEKRNG